MIIPVQVDVPMRRLPVANVAVIAVTTLFFGWQMAAPESDAVENLVLRELELSDLFGHMLLHGDLIHLIGNMLFLWVFGNAVCAKLGNAAYPLAYAGLGLGAALVHLAADGNPAIGASGAINGIVGMFLVWYPLNHIRCFALFYVHGGTFSVSSLWMILFWLVFDIWGAAAGGGNVAYWAHLGGFATGFALASVLLVTGVVKMDPAERSLFDVLQGRLT